MNGEHGASMGCRDDEMIRPAPSCLRPFKFTYADCRRFIYLPHLTDRPLCGTTLPACNSADVTSFVRDTSVRLAYGRSTFLSPVSSGQLQPVLRIFCLKKSLVHGTHLILPILPRKSQLIIIIMMMVYCI